MGFSLDDTALLHWRTITIIRPQQNFDADLALALSVILFDNEAEASAVGCNAATV